jgi:SAM-dependent methyltransferase
METTTKIDTSKPYYSFGWKPTESTLKAHDTRDAEKDCQYMLPTLLQAAAAKPDLKLLDVGCGTGTTTISLASYMPNGHVTGIDYSETVLERARQHVQEKNAENVTFLNANAYSLPFDDGAFDIVHTHQVVVHLQEHVQAIKELIRVTRTGGYICMREADLYTVRLYPVNPVLEESWRAFIEMHELQGLECDGGRKLKAWTKEAGIAEKDIHMTAGTMCFATGGERQSYNGARLWEGPLAEKAIQLGVATP